MLVKGAQAEFGPPLVDPSGSSTIGRHAAAGGEHDHERPQRLGARPSRSVDPASRMPMASATCWKDGSSQ